jgi:hypothetical protein
VDERVARRKETAMTNRLPDDDKYARESFTFRRMKPAQIWAIGIVAVAVLLVLLFVWPR